MESWFQAIPALLVSVVVFIVPGLLIGFSLRLRTSSWLTMAAPLSILVVGVSGLLAKYTGLTWSWGFVACFTIVIALAIEGYWLWKLRTPEPSRHSQVITFTQQFRLLTDRKAEQNNRIPYILIGILGAFAIILVRTINAIPSPELFAQTYDGQFHLNVAARILLTGDASSFGLYSINHPMNSNAFYPGGWHSMVALVAQITGVSIPVATNTVWIAMAGLVWPASIIFLSRQLLGNRFMVIFSSAILSVSFTFYPYLLLEWGTLYSTALAMSIMPTGVGLVVTALGRAKDTNLTAKASLLLLIPWFGASLFTHPRSLATFAVIVAPLLIAYGICYLRDNWRTRPKLTRILLWGSLAALVITAIAAFFALEWYADVTGRTLESRLNGPQSRATESIPAALGQLLTYSPFITSLGATLPPSLFLAGLVLIGVGIAFTKPDYRWVAAAYVIFVIIAVLAIGSDSNAAKLLGALWYKDKYRILGALPIVATPLAIIALMSISGFVTSWASKIWKYERITTISKWTTGLWIILLLVIPQFVERSVHTIQKGTQEVFALPDYQYGKLINSDGVTMLKNLDQLVPDDAVIVGNPWNGSALALGVAGHPVLFGHMIGKWTPEQLLIADRLDKAQTDPEVCRAVKSLNVRYLLNAGGNLWGGHDYQAKLYPGVDRAESSNAVTEVSKNRGATLYRINDCNTEPSNDVPG